MYTDFVGILQRYNTLFSRLLFSFFAVLLIPVLILSFYYGLMGNRVAVQALKKQGEISCAYAAGTIRDIIADYRHKAYQLSNNPLIMSMLEADLPIELVRDARAVYELLFTVMKGDIDFASAHVVSSSGNVRYSTHFFPSSYDLRYNRSDWSPFFDLSRAHKDTASLVSLSNRYANSNNLLIIMNILRRVQDSDGQNIGYVVVDVFQNVFTTINRDLLFEDIILIDSENYRASSLMHTDRYGSFDKFDSLAGVRLDTLSASANSRLVRVLKPIEGTSLVLAGIIDNQHYVQNTKSMYFWTPHIILCGLFAALLTAFFLSRSIARPVNSLISTMQGVGLGLGELRVQKKEPGIYEMLLLNSAFNDMITQLESLIAAERKALEAQLNPHFLYNTLNTVKSLAALHGEKEIVTIITGLGRLLRSSIQNTSAEVTIKESLDLACDYLAIQKIRFGKKLHTAVNADEDLMCVLTPKFVIQPLVENALIHGLEPKIGSWYVEINVRKKENFIIIEVNDNGVGVSERTSLEDFTLLKESGHVGLYNIYRRLELRYGSSFSFTVQSEEGKGTRAVIVLPAHIPKDGDVKGI